MKKIETGADCAIETEADLKGEKTDFAFMNKAQIAIESGA